MPAKPLPIEPEILAALQHSGGPSARFRIEDLPSIRECAGPLEYVVDGFIAKGTVTLLSGASNHGKSWFALALARAVAFGRPFIGRAILKLPVLIVDGENPGAVMRKRIEDLGVIDGLELKVWGGWNEFPPEGPDHQELIRYARQFKPVIVVDSLIEFHPGSENDASETRRYMKGFRRLANEGATVIILCHTGKGEKTREYRGSVDIKGAVDQAYLWEFVGDEFSRARGPWTLSAFKNRISEFDERRLVFENGDYRETNDNVRTNREIVLKVIESNPDINQSDLVIKAHAEGVAKGRALAVLGEIERDGMVMKRAGSRTAVHYRMRGPDV